MNKILQELITEAINLEYKVSDLYMLFYEQYPEDEGFWWKLMLEEKNHASLLKTINTFGDITGEFPNALIPEHLKEILDSNENVTSVIKNFKEKPDRNKAFKIAIEIEESAGEAHYQVFINNPSNSKVINVFKKLGKEDSDHADRIRTYMKEKGI